DQLFIDWNKLNILGRIYVATEGINAQLSVPEQNWSQFRESMNSFPFLRNVLIKKAIQDGNSFYKLTVKVRKELVAYGVPKNSYDMNKVGNHLSAEEFNQALEKPETIIVDMRNYYESEVGRFESAVIPDVEISKELLPEVKQILDGKEEEQILLYCTGGIRCEKASSYLMNHGFKNVNQLSGGIIQYVHEINKKGLKSKFIGKNFVFDDRLGERVTEDVIAKCHICGASCDTHTDCKNNACHILFIQCETCFKELDGCCSKECNRFFKLPIEEQKIRRKDPTQVVSRTFFDSRIKPKLN
ncbi:MAG: oxygen-dependent tRNA uridine(34) hydroxylase TrhO, partial [Fidelibacterota bacterium]